MAQGFVAVKVNTEGSLRDAEVAQRYDVTSLPTILFVSPGGRPLVRVNGFQGPGRFPRTLERAKETATKVIAWEQALDKNPHDPAALAALGTHLYEQEFFEESRDLLTQAARVDAESPPATRRQTRMLLAIIQNFDQKYGEAEALIKESLAILPLGEDEPKLLFILGRTYMKGGRASEARRLMQQIVAEHPQSPMAEKAREQLALLERK
jgi:tetratricopeptide (TPR) repeat protein